LNFRNRTNSFGLLISLLEFCLYLNVDQYALASNIGRQNKASRSHELYKMRGLSQRGRVKIQSIAVKKDGDLNQFEVNRNRQSTDFEFPAPSLEDGGAVSKREYLRHQSRKQTTTCRGTCD
jgi:hypothetical protein